VATAAYAYVRIYVLRTYASLSTEYRYARFLGGAWVGHGWVLHDVATGAMVGCFTMSQRVLHHRVAHEQSQTLWSAS